MGTERGFNPNNLSDNLELTDVSFREARGLLLVEERSFICVNHSDHLILQIVYFMLWIQQSFLNISHINIYMCILVRSEVYFAPEDFDFLKLAAYPKLSNFCSHGKQTSLHSMCPVRHKNHPLL